MGSIGVTELVVILVIALLIFGAGRVADIGKGLGEGIRNFKKGLKEDEQGKDQAPDSVKQLKARSSEPMPLPKARSESSEESDARIEKHS